MKKVEQASAAKAAEKAKEEKEKDVPKKVELEEKKDESQIVYPSGSQGPASE